jgi:hypothetical protein
VIRIILGIVGILLSTGAVILGAGFLSAENAIGGLDPEGRGSIPGSVRFDADERDYTVAFNTRQPETRVNDARCTITHPNESVTRIRGDRQAVAEEGVTIGEFEGQGGTTTVECTLVERDLDNIAARFTVAPQREWIRIVGFVFIGAGVAGILLSVVLILFGTRARSRQRPGPA